MGWTVTGAYALSAGLCLATGLRERQCAGAPDRFPRFWFALGGALLILTVNKQLDLQAALTAAGRDWSRTLGLYHHRALLQAAFVAAVALCFVCAAGAAARFAGRRLLRVPMACCGVVVLMGLVVLRAASFHHVAAAVANPLPLLLELAGAALISADAVRGAAPTCRGKCGGPARTRASAGLNGCSAPVPLRARACAHEDTSACARRAITASAAGRRTAYE